MLRTAQLGVCAIVFAVLPRTQEFEYRLVHEDPLGGADSAVSPDGNWIAFSSRSSGNLDLWRVEVATGKLEQLTDSTSRDYEPRWHPDGTKIVFTSDRDRNQDIFTLDLKTGAVQQETKTDGVADYPSYSKDGAEIVFTSGPFGRNANREVHVKNLETGEIRQVTKGHRLVGSASFAADGKRIVYHAYYDSYSSGKSDVWTVAAGGGDGTNITKQGKIWDYKPYWSHDGEWITFCSKRGTRNFNIFVMRPDGSDLRPITNQEGPDFRWPNFTRDGRVAWHAIEPQVGRILAVDVESGEVTSVVKSESVITQLLPSPDGSLLMFIDRWGIRLIDVAQPDQRPRWLAFGRDPRWAADGKSVTYVNARSKNAYRIPVAGGKAEPIEARPAAVPASTDARVSAVEGALVLIGDDGEERKLADNGAEKTSPVLSPDGRSVFYCQSNKAMVRYYLTTRSVTN